MTINVYDFQSLRDNPLEKAFFELALKELNYGFVSF